VLLSTDEHAAFKDAICIFKRAYLRSRSIMPDDAQSSRRIGIQRQVYAERLIGDAVRTIEEMDADPRLTEVVLLSRAQDNVTRLASGKMQNCILPSKIADGPAAGDRLGQRRGSFQQGWGIAPRSDRAKTLVARPFFKVDAVDKSRGQPLTGRQRAQGQGGPIQGAAALRGRLGRAVGADSCPAGKGAGAAAPRRPTLVARPFFYW
jgi:hypothetical protein